MVAESPTNFHPLIIVNHYCAVWIELIIWKDVKDELKV